MQRAPQHWLTDPFLLHRTSLDLLCVFRGVVQFSVHVSGKFDDVYVCWRIEVLASLVGLCPTLEQCPFYPRNDARQLPDEQLEGRCHGWCHSECGRETSLSDATRVLHVESVETMSPRTPSRTSTCYDVHRHQRS